MVLPPLVRTFSIVGYLVSSSYVSFQLLAGGILPEAAVPTGFVVSVAAWPVVVGRLTFDAFRTFGPVRGT